jgi:hypothetical protein
MQKFIFVLVGFIFFSCNDDADSTSVKDTTNNSTDTSVIQTTTDTIGDLQTIDPSDYKSWQIADVNDAREMIRKFNASCKHRSLKVEDIKAKIDGAFPDALYDKKMVPAKHHKTSHDKYAMLRGMKPGDEKSKVNGFCTEIYWVLARNKKKDEVEEYYFDISTICPPPELEKCDKKDTTKSKKAY